MSLTGADLFAGLGGNSFGAVEAGVNVLWAANHCPTAVQYHELNHKETKHSLQDLQQADFSLVPSHDFMMASPCCQGHTNARGKEGPHHHQSRATAWAPLDCVEHHLPEFFMIENVPKMQTWKLYKHWLSCFKSLGYSISENIIDAADHGVPQNRERLFIIGTKSKAPFELNLEKEPHVPVLDVLDLESGNWSDINKKGRAKATLDRINSGRARFGDLFVMPYYGSGSGKTGRDIMRPCGTIPTKSRWAIVNGNKMRMFTVPEYRRIMSFPKETILPPQVEPAVRLLGNATCPRLISKVVTQIARAA